MPLCLSEAGLQDHTTHSTAAKARLQCESCLTDRKQTAASNHLVLDDLAVLVNMYESAAKPYRTEIRLSLNIGSSSLTTTCILKALGQGKEGQQSLMQKDNKIINSQM